MLGLVSNLARWSQSCGPAVATINSLIEAGWKPAAPDRWRSPRAEMAMVSATPYANALIKQELRSDMEAVVANEAEEHADGQGIGRSINLGPARAAQRFFIREGRWREAAAVDAIVCGTIWDPKPREGGDQEYRNEEFRCRCNKRRLATRLHTLWLCPDNGKCEDPLAKDTADLVKEAAEKWSIERCRWARGILPESSGYCLPHVQWDELQTWA